MDQSFETVELEFDSGSMTPSEIQAVLDEVLAELADPTSELSRESAELQISVDSLKVPEDSAFVPAVIVIGLAIHFAGGAAEAGGELFFDRVIKPRIIRHKADGIGERVEKKDDPQT